MATSSYQAVRQMVDLLSREDQQRLLREVTNSIAANTNPEAKHSIMELCGLGAEIWEGIDAQQYVKTERASWDG